VKEKRRGKIKGKRRKNNGRKGALRVNIGASLEGEKYRF
jgi:hypothetical protein